MPTTPFFLFAVAIFLILTTEKQTERDTRHMKQKKWRWKSKVKTYDLSNIHGTADETAAIVSSLTAKKWNTISYQSLLVENPT